MKKHIISIMICLFALAGVYAADVSAVGSGATQQEARDSAVKNLNRQVSGEFVHSGSITTTKAREFESFSESSRAEDTISSSQTVSSSGSYAYTDERQKNIAVISRQTEANVVSGYLNRVEYKDEKKTSSGYSVTAYIADNQLNMSFFLPRLRELAGSINSLYNNFSKQTNNKAKKSSLVTLYGELTEYEGIKQLLLVMGHSDEIQGLSAQVNSATVFTEYQNIILQEGYELEERSKNVKDNAEYQMLLNQISENRAEQRRLEREKSEQTKAREDAAKKALESRLAFSYASIGAETPKRYSSDNERYSTLREDIFTARKVFLDSCNEFSNLCMAEAENADRDYKAELKALNNRPYRLAELKNGKPIDTVSEAREKERDYLFLRNEYRKVEQYKTIKNALLPAIRKKYENYQEAVSKINGKTFEILLTGDLLRSVNARFDAVNSSWTVSVDLNRVAGLNQTLSITLSYEELTGKKQIPPKNYYEAGYQDYLDYQDSVDYLNKLIGEFAKYFSVSVRFKSVVNERTGIGYENIDLTNITLIVSSSAIEGNKDFTKAKKANPSKITGEKELDWILPVYTKTFDMWK